MARKKVSKRRLREAIQVHHGNVRSICDELNITRSTFYNYKNADDEVSRLVKEARESITDIAESQLMRHVTQVNDGLGDLRAITFVLETWGKDKGWSKRTEITGADGQALLGVSLSDDVMAYLVANGVEPDEVTSYAVRQFEEIVRAAMQQEKAG